MPIPISHPNPSPAFSTARLIAVSAVLFALFAVLGTLAYTHGVLPWDIQVARLVQSANAPGIAIAMIAISAVGYTIPSISIALIVALTLWAWRQRLAAAFTLLTYGADALNWLLKRVVARPRPDDDLVRVLAGASDAGFPSGHVTHYVVFYGFLLYLAWTGLPRSWLRTAVLVITGLLIALVGVSRVYLGAHWPTDVLGGYLFGGGCLAALIAAFRLAEAWLGGQRARSGQ